MQRCACACHEYRANGLLPTQMVMGRPIRVDVAEDRPQKGGSTGALLTLAHVEHSCNPQNA